MPKGYWIANNTVTDAEAYGRYREANAPVFARHGGKFLVRAGSQTVREGEAGSRSVVIEFPSLDAAVAAYEDPEYQAAAAIRKEASFGHLIIVEGYDA